MPGFKPSAKSGKAGKAGAAKAGHATPGKSGGCGTGAGGFKAGNTCGHRGNRNQHVESARAAHAAAKAEVVAHAKAHRKASKAAAKAGTAAPHPKELHAAVKRAAAAHVALKDAQATHKASKRTERNVKARESRAIAGGKASPIAGKPAPAHTGLTSSQARSPSTDKGSRADRLAVLAHRHQARANELQARAQAAYGATGRGLAAAGKTNSHIEGKPADRAYGAADALSRRSGVHQIVANRLGGQAGGKVAGSKAPAAKPDSHADQIKSYLSSKYPDRKAAESHIKKIAAKMSKEELFKAAHAGGHDGAKMVFNKEDLIQSLASHHHATDYQKAYLAKQEAANLAEAKRKSDLASKRPTYGKPDLSAIGTPRGGDNSRVEKAIMLRNRRAKEGPESAHSRMMRDSMRESQLAKMPTDRLHSLLDHTRKNYNEMQEKFGVNSRGRALGRRDIRMINAEIARRAKR